MFKKLKHLTKEFLVFLVIFTMVCWSVSLPLTYFIKDTKAAGGIEIMYIDDGGSTPDVYLNSTTTPEAFLKITAYETESGTNTLDSITVNLDQAMNCSGSTCTASPFVITDLADLSTTTTSGLSLWLDDGDGNFELNEDSLLSDTSPPSAWTTPDDPCPPPNDTENKFWQTTFSNLNLSIPTSFSSRLTIFVAALAKENLNASPLHKFMPFVPQNGIDISTTAIGASITDFPTETCGWMFMPVTLGTEGSGSSMNEGSPVVISEIQTAASAGTGTNYEFIELYNRTPDPISLADLQLAYTASTTSSLASWDATSTLDSVNIPGYGYYLIGKYDGTTGYTGGDQDEFYSEFSLDETGGFVGLLYVGGPGVMVADMVGYGSLTDPSLAEGGSPAPAPEADGSIERKAYPSSMPSTMIGGVDSAMGNGSDSNNNSADFIVRLAADGSDPQNSSSAIESDMMLDTNRGIVLNEILYNTTSGNGWIEIYNASTTKDIVLTNYVVEIATTTATSTAHTYTIPTLTASSGSFVLIEWNESETNDTDSSDGLATLYAASKLDMSTIGGDITLWNSSGAIVDYVQYGGPNKYNEANAVAAGQWCDDDYKPTSNYNESIARQGTTGDDYNDSVDWMYMSSPSPGYPNTGGDSTAPTAVTNVVLSDTDTANYGLDGLDVRVTWSPASAQDSSFDRYELYLLPESTSLDTAQHSAYATLYGQYYYESGTASTSYVFTGYSDFSMTMDSAGATLSDGANYRAYVVAVDFSGNRSSAVGSASAILNSDAGGDDTVPPMIDHMGVWEARVGDDLTFYAIMNDDRDQCGIATSSLIWKIGDDVWANATTTACTLPPMIGSACLRQCVISWSSGWDANTTIYYYMLATDSSQNSTYVGMYPTSNENEAQASPVDIDFVATASWDDDGTMADITGIIYDESGSPLQDAFVIIEGVATTTATTTSAGVFTFPDNAVRHPWADIRIMKSGYMNEMRTVEQNGSSMAFYLYDGYMSMGTGGSAGGNGIMSTAPFDMTMMAPTNISCGGDCSSSLGPPYMPIVIWFFNNMNAATIDDMDASNAGSNIYITSDGQTKFTATSTNKLKVKYVDSDKSARLYTDTLLEYDTFYTVVITPNVLDSNGNPIEANRANGNYEFSFSTMSDGTTMWDSGYDNFGGGGMMMPPYVIGTNPTPGSYDIPLGSVLTVEFSEPMDPASIANSITLYPTVSETSVSLDSATKRIATISHTSAFAANTTYEIRVMGSAKSQLGIWLTDPMSVGCTSNPDDCSALSSHAAYTASFKTSASADTTQPTIAGSYPASGDGITNSSVVDVAMSSIELGFSEAINPNTITSQSITLKKGTVSTAGTISYNAMSNSAKFIPVSALSANSVYTLTASTSITDLSGNALNISSGNNIISFKTGSADTVAPQILYANGDDYSVAITFTEPMNAALPTDATNYQTSVLNIDNYIIKYSENDGGTWVTSANPNAVFSYDQETNTVTISGLGTPDLFENPGWYEGESYSIDLTPATVSGSGVNDKSGNEIATVMTFQMPIQASTETYGMLGPMGGPGMMMSGDMSMNMGTMGMFGAGAMPMNAMAGQTSLWFIDIPVTTALEDGMQVVLTFPTGFDVSAVAPDPYSPMNNDMNEWNNGTVTFDTSWGTGIGGIASTTNNVITIKLNVSGTVNTTAGPDGFIDFLVMDLKGIRNSSIPKDFGTSGYTVDIKTKSAAGALLENITTMPFFISEAGANTLTVVVTAPDAGTIASTTTVFLGSPMTGPMEAVSTNFVGNIATSTFTNLPNGDFMLFTDPYITIGTTNYLGKPMPEPIYLTASTTKTITLEKEGSGTVGAVTVYLQGDYSTGGTADDVDIFANSPSGFRVKTLTSVGSSSPNTTLYLTEGDWMMGIGPAMPKGPMAGPPKMPDWMEPRMVNIVVGIEAATATSGAAAIGNAQPITLNVGSTNNFQVGDVVTFATGAVDAGATSTITSLVVNTSITVTPQGGNWATLPLANDTITSIRESSSGDNDSKIFFNIGTQTLKNIKGFVVDESGSAIGNAEVYAYQPQGFGGGHATTDTAGKFTLKVGTNGVWTIGAFKPGLPGVQEKSVEVKDNTDTTDGNTGTGGADVYLNGSIIHDANSNNAGTNPLRLKLKRPSYTISGKVLNASSTAVAYAPVWAYETTGWGHTDTMTDASGNYILYVDAGTWTVEADAPGVGWLQYDTSVVVSTASQSNINLRPASNITFHSVSGNISIDGSNQTYIPLRAVAYDANGYHLGRDYGASTDSNGNYTLSLPTGYYRIDTWVPSYGEIGLVYDQVANSPANINVTAATTTANILVAAADLKTVSLQFNNGAASQTGFLHIEGITTDDPPKPTGFFFSQDINGLAATSTIKLKTGHYLFFLDVPGLGSYIPTLASRNIGSGGGTHIHVNGDRAVYFTLTDLTGTDVITISGTVQDNSNNALANAWVWLGNPNSHFHTGTESASDGSFSLTVPVLNSGSYGLGADKPGYMPTAPATIAGTQNSTNNTITLTSIASNSQNITGYVRNTSGTALANAMVWAEEVGVIGSLGTGKLIHTQADSNGYYALPVTNGTWSVMANADGYVKSYYKVSGSRTDIAVSGTSQSPSGAINFSLTADTAGIKSKSKPITPASGGTLDDTAQDTTTKKSSGTGLKLTAPPNALGSSASTGNLSAQSTAAVTKTNSSQPFKDQGVTVAATDNSGQAINNLDDNMDMQMVIYKADVDAEIASGDLTYAMLKNTNNGYWDASLNNWVNLTTTRTAYYKTVGTETEWTLYTNATSTDVFETFIDGISNGSITAGDYKLVFNSQTDHLTIFAIIMPFIATPAQAAPSTASTPTTTTSPGGGPGAGSTYCTNVEYDQWQDICINGWQYRNVLSQSPSGCALTSEQESQRKRQCGQTAEEDIVTEIVDTAKQVAQEFTQKLITIATEAAEIVKANVNALLGKLGFKRNLAKEQVSVKKYVKALIKDVAGLPEQSQHALTNFIAYGTETTLKLGEGERAGVVDSYKSAFGRLPSVEAEWNDVIKIANGRWPSERNDLSEANATAAFKKVYLREPNRFNPHDDAAVTVIAYGLRPADRNLNSEKAAIKIFKNIYGYNPSTATAWDIVRAIAYSGATR